MSQRRAYSIMKANGPVIPSPTKARKRKWVRYERIYSNAMWHTNWHEVKDSRMKGLYLITWMMYSDVSPVQRFLKTPPHTMQYFPYVGPLDGLVYLQLYCRMMAHVLLAGAGVKSQVDLAPTLFESELLILNIGLINSRPYHPHANGKLECFHRSLEDEIWHYNTLMAILSSTMKGGYTPHWTLTSTTRHWWHFNTNRQPKIQGGRTQTRWRYISMDRARHDFDILHVRTSGVRLSLQFQACRLRNVLHFHTWR